MNTPNSMPLTELAAELVNSISAAELLLAREQEHLTELNAGIFFAVIPYAYFSARTHLKINSIDQLLFDFADAIGAEVVTSGFFGDNSHAYHVEQLLGAEYRIEIAEHGTTYPSTVTLPVQDVAHMFASFDAREHKGI